MALGAFAAVSGAALVAGFLTPAAAAAAGLATLLMAVAGPPPAGAGLLIDRTAAALLIVVALALAMLGPGALSIDARLFGRREIVIPERTRRRTPP
jgi:uncharacterized membrane protein YphA (DoxX/SURF4 family)